MSTIEVYKGNNLIGSFSLTADMITVGRAGSNDIVLADDKLEVSRYHAVLLKQPSHPGRYAIRDLSSTWGIKINNDFILQKIINHNDEIYICNFVLKYSSTTDEDKSTFRMTDSIIDTFFSQYPSDIGSKKTIAGNLEEILEVMDTVPSENMMVLLEEFISRVNTSSEIEEVFENAMDLAFFALNLKDGCMGCFSLFEGEQNFRLFAKKGMENRAAIPLPRIAAEKVKAGHPHCSGGLLYLPFGKEGQAPLGFLYLAKAPYSGAFGEDESRLASTICGIVGRALDHMRENKCFREMSVEWPRNMIGCDQIYKEIERLSDLDVDILLLGETGVGKEVAAEEIHRNSRNRDKVLRKVNCPAIPKDLVESELFGHKKGAFTGATEDKKGEFHQADGGTIFLDEIGDLPWDSQRKLLRTIREKVFKRLGEEKDTKVDVRVIAATNRDLQKDMEDGRFGSDLYFSFGERIFIPPLRERKRDIPILAHYFLDKEACKGAISIRGITSQAMRYLVAYNWPGNVRELRNCISTAFSKSKGVIFVKHLSREILKGDEPDEYGHRIERKTPSSLDEAEKSHIIEILQYTRGNKEKALELLKISKQTLYNKMRRYNIPINFGKL